MSEQQLADAGVNSSHVHVDFMIGSSALSIDGVNDEGKIETIFRNGNWSKK